MATVEAILNLLFHSSTKVTTEPYLHHLFLDLPPSTIYTANHCIITSFSKETPTHRIKAYATLLSSAKTETREIESDRTVEGNRHPQLTYLAH
ncbi:hypothetical protein YC2023_025819 [Brassica napus]